MKQSKNWLVLGLLAFGVAMRVLPYVLERYGIVSATDFATFGWNISPVPALCLLGGAYLTSAWMGFGIGFAAYVLSDALIYLVSGYPFFYKTLPFVYAGFILYGVIGLTLRKHRSAGRIAITAILAELVFFLVSNFGEWAIGDNQYPESISGLVACYIAALPFWKNSLLGMCLYAPILFGMFALLDQRVTGTDLENAKLEFAPAPRA